MTKTSPAQFVSEVRQEAAKVTWPSRKETILTTIMVCIMAIIASIFFLFADAFISRFVDWLLKLGV